MTQVDGERKLADKEISIRPWWFLMDGGYFLSPRYANKVLELAKGKPSIACGEEVDDVLEVLNSIREATMAGEVDKILETTAKAARDRMTKK